MKAHIVVEREDADVDLVVTGYVTPHVPARLHPVDLASPEHGGEVEVVAVFERDGKTRWQGVLTSNEERAAERALVEAAKQAAFDAAGDMATR